MEEKRNFEIHNEEVREIMKEIPGRLVRWGLLVIFLIFLSIIIGSYFFTFKEVVTAPIVITTTNPPAPLISRASGRIAHWFSKDGRQVQKGSYVALIENPANMDDIFKLEKLLAGLDTSNIQDKLTTTTMPRGFVLGDLQNQYNQLINTWENYRDYTRHDYSSQKIRLLQQQIKKQKEFYQLSLEQDKMLQQEIEIKENGLDRHKTMLEKGGISQTEYEDAVASISQVQRNYKNFLASLKSTEINMINQQSSLLAMQEQQHESIKQFELEIANHIRLLKNSINKWKESYLLVSPIKGVVTLTNYWSENHVVTSGGLVATIIPHNEAKIICRAVVPSSDIAKIKTGQSVQIKLSGYPYMEHGVLKGKVQSLSLVPETDGYIVEIGLTEGMVSNYSEQLKLVQQMDGTAEILTNEMRFIYRFINPLKMLFNN